MRKSSKAKSCTVKGAMAAHCLARNPFLLQPCSISAGVFCVVWVEVDASPPSHSLPAVVCGERRFTVSGVQPQAVPGAGSE